MRLDEISKWAQLLSKKIYELLFNDLTHICIFVIVIAGHSWQDVWEVVIVLLLFEVWQLALLLGYLLFFAFMAEYLLGGSDKVAFSFLLIQI